MDITTRATIFDMTVEEYADIRKVSTVAVTRAMNLKKNLVGVIFYRKIGRDWILSVDKTIASKKPKNYLVIRK